MKDDRRIGEKARILREARRRRMAPLALPGTDHHEIHLDRKGLGKKPGGPEKTKRNESNKPSEGPGFEVPRELVIHVLMNVFLRLQGSHSLMCSLDT
jgi:hypothetical protein